MKRFSMKNLPFKTILIALILAIGLILFVGSYSKKGAFSQINIWKGKETIIESQNKDTDNDGLRDWEEELYKTNPYDPDTDGDGYLDGEEINSGHNPLVKAPGDKLTFYPLPIGEKYNITKKVLNDEILDSILDSYLLQKDEYLKDHPEIPSTEEFLALTKKSTIKEMFWRALGDSYPILLDKARQILLEIPEIFEIDITDKDIKISGDNSPQAIKSYLSQVSSFLNSDTFFLQEKGFQALSSALKDDDFSQLDKIIGSNDAKLKRIKEIIAPSSWKEIHKEGLELTLLIRNIFLSFRDIYNDPLKTFVALQEFEEFTDNWNDLMKRAIELAEEQGLELSF